MGEKVLYIGVYAEPELVKKVNSISTQSGQMSTAAIKYSHLISEGLKFNLGNRSRSLFLVPMGIFPVTKKLIWTRIKKDNDYYIPFINFLFFKQFFISIYLLFFITAWSVINYKSRKIIVFNFIYLPFLLPTALLKKLLGLKVTSFVPDLPDYEYSYTNDSNGIKKWLIPMYIKVVKKLYHVYDGLFIITKYMKSHFPNTPTYVIEGFSSPEIFSDENDSLIKKENAIMYAGALYEKFGVRMLIDAFLEIDPKYDLWIFGSGDLDEYIKSVATKNTRVKYFGNVPNKLVLKYEQKAMLLVNPRLTLNEYTKFSFPSKLIEYMQSGTPVLTTKLPGIPEDYYDKMYFVEFETVQDLKKSIEDCLSKSVEELFCFGGKAREYVLSEKSNNKQIYNIISFLIKY